jgi:hypothetical protein
MQPATSPFAETGSHCESVRYQQWFEDADQVMIAQDGDLAQASSHAEGVGKVPRHLKGGVELLQSIPQPFTALEFGE